MTYLSPNPYCIIAGCGHRRVTHGCCGFHHQKLIKCRWLVDELGLWIRDGQIGYQSVHSRLNAMTGDAKSQLCVQCGKQANDHSYDHQDPDELWDIKGVYSLDFDHYQPLCRSCHLKRDRIAKDVTPNERVSS